MNAGPNALTELRREMKPLDWLLLFIPAALILRYAGGSAGWVQSAVFITACLAILPLAGLMGRATEELAGRLGPNIGALMNATLGNAAELIITLLALRAAYSAPSVEARDGLLEVVQASITGSILGNVLLVLGLALLLGGLRHPVQSFNRVAAGTHSSMMLLAVAGLMIPAVFVHAQPGMERMHGEAPSPAVWKLSLGVAAILMSAYLAGLWFSLKTHREVFSSSDHAHVANWSTRTATIILVVATIFVAWMSELLVHGIEPITHQFGLSPIFVGVILIPIIGNAAEHASAIVMAMQNKMDVALGIAIGSSIQIALFVAPLLVFASLLFGHQLSLIFTQVELIAVVFAAAIVALVCHDGETNWLEGLLLLAIYLILGLSFLLMPPATVHAPAPAH